MQLQRYHLAGTKKLKLLGADWQSSCYDADNQHVKGQQSCTMPPPLKSEQNKSANIVRAVTMLKWPDLTQIKKPTMEVGKSNPS